MRNGPSKPSVMVYNSDTTQFAQYTLSESAGSTIEFMVPVHEYVSQELNREDYGLDDIVDVLRKNGMDGAKYTNCRPHLLSEGHSEAIWKRLTYLSIETFEPTPRRAGCTSLTECLRRGESITRLTLHGTPPFAYNDVTELFWATLAGRKMQAVDLSGTFEIPPTAAQLLQICENSQRLSFGEVRRAGLLRQVLESKEATLLYVAKTYALSLDSSSVCDDPAVVANAREFFVSDKNGGRTLKLCRDTAANTKLRAAVVEDATLNGKMLQIDDPTIRDTPVRFTTQLHFWKSDCLPAVISLLAASPGVTGVSSGVDALTPVEMDTLTAATRALGRDIKLGIRVKETADDEAGPLAKRAKTETKTSESE